VCSSINPTSQSSRSGVSAAVSMDSVWRSVLLMVCGTLTLRLRRVWANAGQGHADAHVQRLPCSEVVGYMGSTTLPEGRGMGSCKPWIRGGEKQVLSQPKPCLELKAGRGGGEVRIAAMMMILLLFLQKQN
jgi:hypothetical protein